MLNRRNLLALGGVVGGAMLIPTAGAIRAAGTTEADVAPAGGAHVHPKGPRAPSNVVAPAVTPFSVRMPVPPVLQPAASRFGTDFYRMNIQPADVEILPGLSTPAYTYNGQFVGPTIKARTGRRVRVTYVNGLDRPANVHLHGAHVAASSDGHPMDVIAPGAERVYDYPNSQQGATLWYHDHSHHTEAEHVYHGLHGFYLIEDDAERYLRLPDRGYDVPIMLRDSKFDEHGTLVFAGDPALRNTILANGKPQPYFPVAARKYRFRFLNGANKRIFQLSLAGAQLTQIASDGGLLAAPLPLTELMLGSAERADVIVDFSRYPVGTQLVLTDALAGPVLRFDVVRQAYDDSLVPSRLRAVPALPPATAERHLELRFDFSGAFPMGLINGLPYDASRNDFRIRRGTTEIWNITNADPPPTSHPFHMHLVQFRVLSRNGGPPRPGENGRKDTVLVAPGETVRVQATFDGYLGKYAYHCHFLEHSAMGMMGQMEIVR